jgi:tetratricopeptide (TPR) repeat protein
MTSLLNKSLLVRTLSSAAADRFSMLETLREYAGDRLLETVEAESVRRRHALYHLALAVASVDAVWGSDEATRLEDRLEVEQDNMKAALRWACGIGDVELALRLSASLTHFWDLRGYLDEGRSWLQAALNLQPQNTSPARAHALWRAGMLANRQRDPAAARPLLDESRNIYQGLSDKENLVKVLNALAVMSMDSDYEAALEYHAQSLALRRDLGDKSKIAATLHNMSVIKMHQGKWDEASALSLESQALYGELNAQLGVAYTHYVLGNVAVGQGDYVGGLNELQECLNVSRQMKSKIMIAWTLSDMAEAHYRQDDYARAQALLTEARAMFLEMGDALGLATVLVQLGRDASRIAAYADAGALYEDALAHALESDNHLLTGSCLAGFAGIAVAKERPGEAAMLFGCAQAQLALVSSSLERRAMTLGLDEARAALGEEAWDVYWSKGYTMSSEQAVELAKDQH